MIRKRLCHYNEAQILVKGTITIIFKNCGTFNDCISEINNKRIDHDKDIDVVMPMHHLIKYSDNYLKTSGSLWQYFRDEPFLINGDIIDDPDRASFKYIYKKTDQRGDNETKDVQIMVQLKYLNNVLELLKQNSLIVKLIFFNLV